MQFCPKCGAILVQKRKNAGCPRCDYSSKEKADMNISEKIEKKQKLEVLKEKDLETRPITTEICEQCGNDKAYFWTVQQRASDEAETKFFQCTKCKFTRRDQD